MRDAPERIVERRVSVFGEHGGHLHATRSVPVPEGNREGGVVDKLAQDSLVEVEVPAVEGEEEPGVVDLEIEFSEPDLVVSAVAVGAVDVGLLLEAARVVVGEALHERQRSLVLGDVVAVHSVRGWPDPQAGPTRRAEIDGVRGVWGAAFGHDSSREEVGSAAFGQVRREDGVGDGERIGSEARGAI